MGWVMDRPIDPSASPGRRVGVLDERLAIEPHAPLVGLRALIGSAFGRDLPVELSGHAFGAARADAVVVFDFGAGDGARTAEANDALAAVTATLPHLPALGQTETSRLLAREGRAVVDLEESARDRFGLGDGDHVDTGLVVDELAALCDRLGWTTIAVVAHPVHLARCLATCQRRGLKVVPVPGVEQARRWDGDSRQWWTRGPRRWALRELAVVAHQALAGRVLLRF